MLELDTIPLQTTLNCTLYILKYCWFYISCHWLNYYAPLAVPVLSSKAKLIFGIFCCNIFIIVKEAWTKLAILREVKDFWLHKWIVTYVSREKLLILLCTVNFFVATVCRPMGKFRYLEALRNVYWKLGYQKLFCFSLITVLQFTYS